jgi:hypothetical protein
MHKQTENRPIGGIDSDSENRLLESTDYRYALNVSNSVGYDRQFGVLTNVKGNVLIDNYSLPSGINKCIGSYYDRGENTTFYFVYNNLGQQKILRYYPNKTSNLYPFGTIQEIITFDFGWSDEEHITGVELVDGKLLYWTDSVKPRMINVVKGNVTEKKKSWKVYLPKNYVQPFQTWGWSVYDMGGTQLFAGFFSFSGNATREQAFEQIAATINASQNFVTAESCGCDLNVTEVGVNQVYFDFAGNANYQVVADNWYGLNLIDRYFDLIKWIPAFEPTYEWRKDTERQSNFVKNNVWQFRLQYIYDNNEESKLSPISNIALNNISCNDQNYDLFNYIKVNFNNADAVNSNNWVILKSVRVLYRIGNEGLWRDVVTLEPCDFFALSGTDLIGEYDFYNDQVTAAVSDSLTTVPFDVVPRKANALTFTQGRLVTGGALQGYNAPDCVDANLTVNVDDVQAQPLYKVSGAVRIYQPTLMNSPATPAPQKTTNPFTKANAPIWQIQTATIDEENPADPQSSIPMFGGVIVSGGTVFIENKPGTQSISPTQAAVVMQQYLPEGGFVAYAAGTDTFAITKQVSRAQLSQLDSGIVDFSSTSGRDRYRDYLQDKISNPLNQDLDLLSTFEMELPAGRYVIRLASHWCSFGDVLGKGAIYDLRAGRSYQQTSTNVYGVDDSVIGGSWKGSVGEIVVEVTNSDVYIGEFVVQDMVLWQQLPNNSGDGYYKVFTGYLYDASGSVGVEDLQSAISVERSLVTLDSPPNIEYNRCVTDHNGYFFTSDYFTQAIRFIADQVSATPSSPIALREGGDIIYRDTETSALFALKNGTLTPYSASSGKIWNNTIFISDDFNDLILPVTNTSARNVCSSLITGRILDANGEPVFANLVYTNGRQATQDNLGNFRLIAWGSRWQNGYINDNNRIYDNLIYGGSDFCTITYDNGGIETIQFTEFGANPTTTPPPYSPTAVYDTGTVIATDSGNVILKSQKRGSFKRFGVRYSDEAGRYTTVIPVANIYIPFITEPLDAIGQVGVFRTGAANIDWSIQADAPQFASTYQWVRTKDRIYGKQLSWICADVQYLALTSFGDGGTAELPEILTSFEAGGYSNIKVSLTSIVDYYRLNNDSLATYEFDEGDRLRLVADKDGVRYQQLIDFEIVNYETTTQSLILKNNGVNIEITDGCMIEIYNSLLGAETEEEVWYEVGECFDVVNGQHSVTSGTFEGGDSYFRYRKVPVFEAGSNSKYYVDVFECKTISDFYQSEDEDIGRTGLVTASLNEIYRPTLLQHSNVYLPSTQINGLSNFEPANEKELSVSYGELKRLVPIENTLISVHDKKIISNYLQRQLVIDAEQASSLIASSEVFFGTDNPYQQDWGSQHPESVFVWNGYVYGADQRMTLIWRRANDGLNAISDYKAKSLFKSELVGRTSIIGQFDEYKNESVFTLVGGSPAKTIAYFEPKNRWTTFYSFLPEMYGQSGNNIVSFVSGRLWLHDRNSIYNNFYGVQSQSELWYIVNDENIAPKVWQAMYLEILNEANTNNWTLYELSNDNGQLSRIDKSSFVKKEAYWHSSFKRDLNTAGVTNPIVNGRAMRSNMLVVKMRNDGTSLETLKGIVTAYQVSERITF